MMTEDELMPQIATPGNLLQLAVTSKVGVQELEKLTQLYEQWEQRNARKQFLSAFTQFQKNCPDIRKTKDVSFRDVKQYSFAPLSDITRQINPVLEKYGLSYRWKIDDNEKEIKVSCIISHISGHDEITTMSGSPDTTGSKNSIQARGSSVEYLKRYTLIGALGISTADSDIDGRLPEPDVDKLHNTYMEVYNQLIQLNSKYGKYDPDNWKSDRTPTNYVKAIGEVRRLLFEEQQKNTKK